MSSRRGRAFRAEQREAAARAAQYQTQSSPKSADAAKFNNPGPIYGASSGLSSSVGDWFERNKDNPAVGAAANDLAYNSFTAAAKTESDARYADTMSPRALSYQQQSQDIDSKAEERSLAAQGEQQRQGYRVQGDEQRQGYRTQGEEERKTLTQGTTETIALRNDARNAIRQGSPLRTGGSGRYFA